MIIYTHYVNLSINIHSFIAYHTIPNTTTTTTTTIVNYYNTTQHQSLINKTKIKINLNQK